MCEQNINGSHEEELKYKAMEHDMSDAQSADLEEAGKAVEEGVTSVYQKIENGVVGGYKKIEDGVVEGFARVSDKFVEKLFAREGESAEDAKKRLLGEKSQKDQ